MPTGFLNMPKLPLIGFLHRLLAFVLDIMIVLSTIWLLSNSLSPAVVALGEFYPYLTALAMFLYFALLNGPLGKGQTIGKMVVRIQVTDLDGATPDLRQGLLRTAILFPSFVLGPLAAAIIGHPSSLMEEYLFSVIAVYPVFAMVLTTSLIIPFNPFKQGLHDFLGQTLVRPANRTETPDFEELTASVGSGWLKFHRQPQISGGITLAMLFSLLCFLLSPYRYGTVEKQVFEQLYALQQIRGFQETDIDISPSPLSEYAANVLVGPVDGEKARVAAANLPGGDLYGEVYQRRIQDDWKALPPDQQIPRTQLPELTTTGTLPIVLDVMRTRQWNPVEQIGEREFIQFADQYMTLIYPKIVEVLSRNVQSRSYAEQLNDREIELNVVFWNQIRSSPPIYLYRYPLHTKRTNFPPLNLELPEIRETKNNETE